MKSQGQRLFHFFREQDANSIHIVSPYLTSSAVNQLLFDIEDNVRILVTTCIDHDLVLSGSTSFAAIKLLHEKPNACLQHVDNLHAKAYIVGEKCLIGSANFTDRGLALGHNANLELLVEVDRQNSDIKDFEMEIKKYAQPVTSEAIFALERLLRIEHDSNYEWIKELLSIELNKCSWTPLSDPSFFQRYLDDEGFHNLTSGQKDNINRDIRFVIDFCRISMSPGRQEFLELLLSMPMIKVVKRLLMINAESQMIKAMGECGFEKERIELLIRWAKVSISGF